MNSESKHTHKKNLCLSTLFIVTHKMLQYWCLFLFYTYPHGLSCSTPSDTLHFAHAYSMLCVCHSDGTGTLWWLASEMLCHFLPDLHLQPPLEVSFHGSVDLCQVCATISRTVVPNITSLQMKSLFNSVLTVKQFNCWETIQKCVITRS